MNRFLGDFTCTDDVFREFSVNEKSKVGVEIQLAYYSYEDYSGFAYVLFKKDGKLYDVEGSHCSCHGLENQWDPTETNEATLALRLKSGSYVYNKEEDAKIKMYIDLALFNNVVEEELSKGEEDE